MSFALTHLSGFGVGPAAASAGGSYKWDSSKKSSTIVLQTDDLEAYANGSTAFHAVLATLGRAGGKYYFEQKIVGFTTGEGNYFVFGLATTTGSYDNYPGAWASSTGAQGNGTIYGNGFTSGTNGGITPGLNDVIGWAVDFDAGKVWMALNNSWTGGGSPASGTSPWKTFTAYSLTLYPACALYSNDTANIIKLLPGASMTYSPPSGFAAWDASTGSQTFTASGTFVVPTYTSLTVKVWGAGGGGGGSFANGNGSAGGQSKFDTSGPTANGGGGGTQGDSTGAGGAGGTASGGDTNTTGNSGSGGNIGGTGVGGNGGAANGSPPGSTGLGGNGADGGFEGNGGGGGGGGGYSTKTYSAGGLTVGASITVTVGAGGSAAPSAQAGQAGRVEITWS